MRVRPMQVLPEDSMLIRLPRVLVIVGEPFNRTTATGHTLSNLFRGWPRGSIAQIYTARMIPDDTLCSRYFRLGLRDLAAPAWGQVLFRRIDQRPVANGGRTANACGSRRAPSVVARLQHCVREQLRMVLDLLPYEVAPKLEAWVKEFEPEVIYTFAGSIRMMRLALAIRACCRCPVVVHFMDDWPETLYSGHVLSPILRPVLGRALQATLAASAERCTISPAMAQEYMRRYGGRFDAFMNCAELSEATSEANCDNSVSEGRLLVMGNLDRGRADLLNDIVRAIQRLRQGGSVLRLIVCTQSACRWVPEGLCDNVEFQEPPSDDKGLQKLLAGAGALLYLDSFQKPDRKYFRYSLSAKLPAYLMSGRPIIVYGPRENAAARYAVEEAWGLVVGSRSAQLLDQTLMTLVTQPDLRALLAANARRCAMLYHEGESHRQQFRAMLARVAACKAAQM